MATQTMYTGKDTYDFQEAPDSNYGGNDRVVASNDTGGTGDHRRGYWGFDITSGPAASQITNVVLHQYVVNCSASLAFSGRFRRITDSWTEYGLMWTSPPAVTTTHEVLRNFPAAISGWQTTTITDLYKDAKNAGNELGIRLYGTVDSGSWLSCYSRDYSSGTYKAYIVITYLAAGDYYVKTSGNDALTGDSWANAWKTINKAATTVLDGSNVHIEHGTYNAEPAANKIAPQNAGASGVAYKPEPVGGGAGAATVIVDKN